MTDYEKILNHKNWQDLSHKIKTRDNLKCQAYDCKTPTSILQVHHIDYLSVKNPWDYPDDMLITLCKDCHKKENYRYKLEGNLFTALKMKGFLYCDILAFVTKIYSDKRFTQNLLNDLREMQHG